MSDERERLPSFEHRTEHDLPCGWAYAALKSLGRWGTGNTPSKANTTYWEPGTLPWVSPKDMKVSYLSDAIDHVTERAVEEGGAAVVPPGTIFFVVRGMILAHTFPVAMTTVRVAFNQDMRSLIPYTEAIFPPYLLRALQQEAPAILGVVREATHGTLRLESDNLLSWPIPVAPLPEQHRIVAAVEALLEKVARAKARLDRVAAILKRFRQAVLAAACSGELTREWREKHPSSVDNLLRRIGASHIAHDNEPPTVLPEGWRWVSTEALCERTRAITYGVIKLGEAVEGGVPTLRSSDVRPLFIDESRIKRISSQIAAQYQRTFLEGGEILVTVRGTLGGIAVVPPHMAGYNISREVAQLPVHRELNPKFLAFAIAAINSQNWLGERAKGVAYTGINIEDLRTLPLPVPPLDEQNEIVRQVDRLFTLADAIEKRVKVAQARAEKLPQAILSKAFSGELVPTEAELARAEGRAYESAEELLRRIKGQATEATTASRKRKQAAERKDPTPAAPSPPRAEVELKEERPGNSSLSAPPPAQPRKGGATLHSLPLGAQAILPGLEAEATPEVTTVGAALQERLARGAATRLGLAPPVLSALLACRVEVVPDNPRATAKALSAAIPTLGLPLARRVADELALSGGETAPAQMLKAARERPS